METRAPLALIGLFVLAAIGAVFGFVYWLNNTGGLGKRDVYTVRFENTVSGLLVGAAVLFDGVRVGEVTRLRLDRDNARQIFATIAVDADTPVRTDTTVGLDFQGLTGVPVISLEGGTQKFPASAPGAPPPVLVADPTASTSMTRAAREALQGLNKLVADNSKSLTNAITDISTFAAALSRNSDRVDGILKGLERMTGGGPESAPPVIYDLTAPKTFPAIDKPLADPIVVPDVTTVLLYDTQKVLVRPSGGKDPSFETARWADSLPRLLQARIVQSFENAKFLGKVTKPLDGGTPKYQLVIDLRRFQISTEAQPPVADVEFSAKLVSDEGGKVVAAKIFHVTVPTKVTNAADAAAVLNEAFEKAATELVVWTVDSA
jgi:phospholipid/cholesterol/gamma-HCH transport system substrate-binding protein